MSSAKKSTVTTWTGCGCAPEKVGGADSELYSGTAAFGRVYAVIGAIFGVIVALVMIIIGITILREPLPAGGGGGLGPVDPAKPFGPDGPQLQSPRAVGWGLIGAGVLLGGITTGIAVASFKYKSFAAGYGALEGASLIAHAL